MLKILRNFLACALFLTASLIEANSMQTCSFCESAVLQNQNIYEDSQVVVLYDHKPIIQGHCLVIPKRHVERLEDITAEEMVSIHKALACLYEASAETEGATGYFIFQKNGREAGQSVPHVHFHFCPRKKGDYSTVGIFTRMLFKNFKKSLSKEEMDVKRQSLSNHFQDFSS
jgi:histidine triad (HIT) family protein